MTRLCSGIYRDKFDPIHKREPGTAKIRYFPSISRSTDRHRARCRCTIVQKLFILCKNCAKIVQNLLVKLLESSRKMSIHNCSKTANSAQVASPGVDDLHFHLVVLSPQTLSAIDYPVFCSGSESPQSQSSPLAQGCIEEARGAPPGG